MQYTAIIFDLDGTAMPSQEKSMPSANLTRVTKRYKSKIHLCAATGRPWELAQPVILALGLTDPCIISGGTVIVDPTGGKILWQEVIFQSSAKAIIEVAQQFDYPISYSCGLVRTVKASKEIITIPDKLNAFYILDIPSDKYSEVLDKLGGIQDITVSKAYSWNVENGIDLHITHQQATKEHAVIELCRMLNVDRTHVAGVGDGYNDVHLFNAVGHKIAMGNAVMELKEQADEVIGSIDEEGLAQFIEESVA